MGTNQHLKRSIVALREVGGIELSDGTRVMPDPVLVGRSEEKLKSLAAESGIERWSTDLAACLADARNQIYFDAQITSRRAEGVAAALCAGKHVYCEKPLAADIPAGLELARLAKTRGLKTGIVQDKLFLPGLLKLKELIQSGFFRSHFVSARRIRLLGLRGRHAPGPAPFLELS